MTIWRRLAHDRRVLILALAAGLPATLAAVWLLAVGGYAPRVQWTFGLMIVGAWLVFGFAAQEAVVRPLQTISNLLAALREEDFSFRAHRTRSDDALSQVMSEVNALAQTLREQRLGAQEATALMRKVMEEIDVAVFAFDGEAKLRLVNRMAEHVLARPVERLLGESATHLHLDDALHGEPHRVLDITFPGASGRWEMRRGTFRQGGLPLQLIVLTNVSRSLREEERQAWQRLIRVLGHELNNSLAPIKSIAGSLESLLDRRPRPADLDDDMKRGLAVIAARSESLSRFTQAYSRLARLPAPELRPVKVAELVRRVAGLETRLGVAVAGGDELVVSADPDQLEQLLINLIRNAVDAVTESRGGGVRALWGRHGTPARNAEIVVEDDGPGLPNTANLFVPFFTTKPHGSGIGLVLCRQIAEAHGGTLTIENRSGATGCRARLLLPL